MSIFPFTNVDLFTYAFSSYFQGHGMESAKVLDTHSVPGIIVGPIALAVGAGRGYLYIFPFVYLFSFLSHSLGDGPI